MGQAAAADRPRRGPAKPRPQPKPKARAKKAPRVRVAGGAVWIGIVAVLLSGVVALNVAVLQLNVQLEDLGTERTRLRAENADLASRIASKAQAGRIHQAQPADAPGIYRGRSLFDGAQNHFAVTPHPQLLLVEYSVGPRDALTPRIRAQGRRSRRE